MMYYRISLYPLYLSGKGFSFISTVSNSFSGSLSPWGSGALFKFRVELLLTIRVSAVTPGVNHWEGRLQRKTEQGEGIERVWDNGNQRGKNILISKRISFIALPGWWCVTCWAVGTFGGSKQSSQTPGDLNTTADQSVVTSCLGLEIWQICLHLLLLPCRQAQLSQVLAESASPAHYSPPPVLDHL